MTKPIATAGGPGRKRRLRAASVGRQRGAKLAAWCREDEARIWPICSEDAMSDEDDLDGFDIFNDPPRINPDDAPPTVPPDGPREDDEPDWHARCGIEPDDAAPSSDSPFDAAPWWRDPHT